MDFFSDIKRTSINDVQKVDERMVMQKLTHRHVDSIGNRGWMINNIQFFMVVIIF